MNHVIEMLINLFTFHSQKLDQIIALYLHVFCDSVTIRRQCVCIYTCTSLECRMVPVHVHVPVPVYLTHAPKSLYSGNFNPVPAVLYPIKCAELLSCIIYHTL